MAKGRRAMSLNQRTSRHPDLKLSTTVVKSRNTDLLVSVSQPADITSHYFETVKRLKIIPHYCINVPG